MVKDSAEFVTELKRRKVVQWTIGYLSAAWLMLQVVDVIGDQFEWSAALQRGITAALAGGFLLTVVLAWFHGEKGQQRVTRIELLLLCIVLVTSGFLVRRLAGGAPAGDARPAQSDIVVDPEAIVVVPFAAAPGDSALERLGRDLAVTVGATLDGIERLQTVDPLTVLARLNDNGGTPLARGMALASELGAGRVLYGSLTRAGSQVRLDATLHDAGAARPLARASALDEPSRIGALTDSVVLSLARQLWQRATPDVPSVASLATSSVAALRAYLDGEHALASGEMPRAIAAFEQAYALDSTYLFAYWRSLYPRSYEGSRPDSATLQQLIARRHELPPVDQLLVEVSMAGSTADRLRLLQSGVQRFPTNWVLWYTYANLLIHDAPYLGTDAEAARTALERVIQLNPGFAPAWEHLFWVVTEQRDTAATAATMARLERFAEPGGYRFNDDLLTLYRTVAHAVVHGDSFSAPGLEQTASYVTGYRGPIPLRAFGTGLLIYSVPHAQAQLNEEVLARNPPAEMASGMWQGLAYAAAARGAWEDVAPAAARWAQVDGAAAAAVGAYGVVVAGAALGFIPAEEAAALRPRDLPADAPIEERAELAWLDGVLAWSRGDAAAVTSARQTLATAGSPLLPLLDGSLAAFADDLRGRRNAAARSLVRLEDDAAAAALYRRFAWTHPYVSTIHRVLAARWLLDEGNEAEAARLLPYIGAVLPGAPTLNQVNQSVGSISLYYRALAAQAMGRERDARTYFTMFLDRYDRPAPAVEPLVRDARQRLTEQRRN